MAIEYCVITLSYPTLVFLAIPIAYFYIRENRWNELFKTILLCVGVAGFLFLYILSKSNIYGVINGIRMITADGSHGFSFEDEVFQIKNDLYYAGKYFFAYAGMFVIIKVLLIWLSRKQSSGEIKIDINNTTIAFISPFFVTILQYIITIASAVAGYIRFLFLVILSFFELRNEHDADYNRLIFVTFFFAFIVICVSSNNGIHENSGYCISLMPIVAVRLYKKWNSNSLRILLSMIAVSQCISFVFSYKVSGERPAGIRQFELIQSETVEGIFVEEYSEHYFMDLLKIKNQIECEKVMVASEHSYAYNLLGKGVYAPVTTSTPHYDKQWEIFLEKYPVDRFNLVEDKKFSKSNDLISMLKNRFDMQLIKETENTRCYYLEKR